MKSPPAASLKVLVAAIGLTVFACSDKEDREATECGGNGFGEPKLYPSAETLPPIVGTALDLTGSLDSGGAFVRSLTIAGTQASATSVNFGTWKVTLAPATLELYRNAGELPVTFDDACTRGRPLAAIKVDIREAAPTVNITEVHIGWGHEAECYLPADGRHIEPLKINAGADAAGVRAVLDATSGTLLNVRPSDKSVLLGKTTDVASSSASAALRASSDKDGFVSVAVNAPGAFDVLEPRRVAVAPVLSAASATVENEKPIIVTATTFGSFASCRASSTAKGSVTLMAGNAAPQEVLNTDVAAIDGSGCGQSLLLRVLFAPGTIEGSPLRLECSDTFGQATSLTLTSKGGGTADAGG